MIQSSSADTPLRSHTPESWAVTVLREPLALLNDHAHLEKKAASNALELLTRWPDPNPPETWVEKLTAVAKDELEHLGLVTRLLTKRGGSFTKFHRNPYAKALHGLVRHGNGTLELLDRLMISALIEARSCERFELLARRSDDAELSRLYRGLWASERRHYHVFLTLAVQICPDSIVQSRWTEMLDAEAEIIRIQPLGPRMHSKP